MFLETGYTNEIRSSMRLIQNYLFSSSLNIKSVETLKNVKTLI